MPARLAAAVAREEVSFIARNCVRSHGLCLFEALDQRSKWRGERLDKIVLRREHPSDRRSDDTIAGLDLTSR
jgi:hypothetical protein